jgi:hypothetical protein
VDNRVKRRITFVSTTSLFLVVANSIFSVGIVWGQSGRIQSARTAARMAIQEFDSGITRGQSVESLISTLRNADDRLSSYSSYSAYDQELRNRLLVRLNKRAPMVRSAQQNADSASQRLRTSSDIVVDTSKGTGWTQLELFRLKRLTADIAKAYGCDVLFDSLHFSSEELEVRPVYSLSGAYDIDYSALTEEALKAKLKEVLMEEIGKFVIGRPTLVWAEYLEGLLDTGEELSSGKPSGYLTMLGKRYPRAYFYYAKNCYAPPAAVR